MRSDAQKTFSTYGFQCVTKKKKGVLSSHQTKISSRGGSVAPIRTTMGPPAASLSEVATLPRSLGGWNQARLPLPLAPLARCSLGVVPCHLRWAGRIRTRFDAAAAGGILSVRVRVALRRSQSSDTGGANPIGRARCWPSSTWLAVLKRHVPAAPLSSVTAWCVLPARWSKDSLQ